MTTDTKGLVTITGDAANLRAFLMGTAAEDAVTIERIRNDLFKAEDEVTRLQEECASGVNEIAHLKSDLASIRNESDRGWRRADENLSRALDAERARDSAKRAAETATEELRALESSVVTGTTGVDLSDEDYAKIAAAKQELYARLSAVTRVVRSDDKDVPLPATLTEFFDLFVADIFVAGHDGGTVSGGCKNKIGMIKRLRAVTGAGLKEAKMFIEQGSALDPKPR